jgi:hypothetical protein
MPDKDKQQGYIEDLDSIMLEAMERRVSEEQVREERRKAAEAASKPKK